MSHEQPWFLQNSGLMKRIQPEDREVFHAICIKHFFGRGDIIFRLGDSAISLHLIASGRVTLVPPPRTVRNASSPSAGATTSWARRSCATPATTAPARSR